MLIPGGKSPGPRNPAFWFIVALAYGYPLQVVAQWCENSAEPLGLEVLALWRATQAKDPFPKK